MSQPPLPPDPPEPGPADDAIPPPPPGSEPVPGPEADAVPPADAPPGDAIPPADAPPPVPQEVVPPPVVPASLGAAPAPVASPVERIRAAYQRRAETDYIF